MTTHTIRVNKAAESFEVDFAKLPDASQAHVIAYGLRQLLNDAAASANKGTASRDAVQKRLDNLMAGTLRASTGRTADPVAREAKSIAERLVSTGKVQHKGKPIPKDHPERAAIIAKVAASDKVQAKARANVKATADMELDIEV